MKAQNCGGCIMLVLILILIGLTSTAYARDRYRPRDTIIIKTCCNMQIGWDVVGRVHRGYTYTVESVEEPWLRITNNNGQTGWIQESYVRPYRHARHQASCAQPKFVRQEVTPVRTITPVQVEDVQPVVEIERPPLRSDTGGNKPTITFLPQEESKELSQTLPLREITVWAKDFQTYRGVTRTSDSIIIGGTADGPHGEGGTAWCEVQLPTDASNLKLRISLWHGSSNEQGKGIHATTRGGRCSVSVSDTTVHIFNCQYNHMHGDWWPDPAAELGHTLPEVDLGSMNATGRSVIIGIRAEPWTCMDLRAINVTPVSRRAFE